MMLIFLLLIATFQLSTSCWSGHNKYFNYVKFITVNEGDSPKLSCYDEGNPYLPIRWHREPIRGNVTLPNGESSCECGNVLEIPSITKNQRGKYFCGTDSVLINISRYIKVNVNFLPILLESRRIDRFDNGKIELGCNIEAYPSPEILWTKNNLLLYTNEQHQIINDYNCNDQYNSTLIISTEFDYNGIYICRVRNKSGQLSMTFLVRAPILKNYSPSDYDGTRGP